MRNDLGQFISGRPAERRYPVGTVRIRTRHKRGGVRRAFIKIAEPNVWILRARHVWESAHGPIPDGFAIHHRDRDKLNDDLSNLDLVSKREHLSEHRSEFQDKSVAALVRARRERRWSTKSDTKRTGRPPTWSDADLAAALRAYAAGEGNKRECAERFGIPYRTFLKRTKGA